MDVTGEQLHALAQQLRDAAEVIDRIAAAADAGVQVSLGDESDTAHLMNIFSDAAKGINAMRSRLDAAEAERREQS